MRFEVFTLLPEIFPAYLSSGILEKARANGLIDVQVHNIRDYTHDRHHTTDDVPYGGGGGMVMKPEPVFEAVETVLGYRAPQSPGFPIILLTPQGKPFNQALAQSLSAHQRLALICGRYEGVDERIRTGLVTEEISIGDYVLTGGELAAMVVVDAVSRLLPGVLGSDRSAVEDSFFNSLLEYPQYTRPFDYGGSPVPEVLISGNHQSIAQWRRKEALRRTWLQRPDLLAKADLSQEDLGLLEEIKKEKEAG